MSYNVYGFDGTAVEYSPVVGGGRGGAQVRFQDTFEVQKILIVNISFYFYIGMSRGTAKLLWVEWERSAADCVLRRMRVMDGRVARSKPNII